jgi:hypothetical protein
MQCAFAQSARRFEATSGTLDTAQTDNIRTCKPYRGGNMNSVLRQVGKQVPLMQMESSMLSGTGALVSAAARSTIRRNRIAIDKQ